MEYRETPPPPHLAGLVKARWTLEAGGAAGGQWIEQQATPDGCVELIRRTRGRSRWNGEQPESFVVGLVDRPQPFEISSDAAFEALRLWPWAWRLIGDIALVTLHGRWQEIPAPDFAAIETRLSAAAELNRIGAGLVAAPSVAAMGGATDMAPRALQRWFARHVGMPPRAYLRLLRFQGAFETLPGEGESRRACRLAGLRRSGAYGARLPRSGGRSRHHRAAPRARALPDVAVWP